MSDRTLCGLRFHLATDARDVTQFVRDLTVSLVGTSLTADGQAVGEITSAAFSPRLSTLLALGYVRRGHNKVGARLSSSLGEVEVIALPV